MFSRLYSALLVGIACLCLVAPLSAQRLVSTSPANKRAVLEEFGGMYCVYCPRGHRIIADLQEALGESFVSLNYHVGSYAVPLGPDPDLRSNYGEAIAQRTALSGYPAGTVNRKVFPGMEQDVPGSTALNRSNWASAVQQTLTEEAVVNLAMEAALNVTTRELEVYIEYYYTADGPGEENFLHLAILQNNVLAPQHGGGQGAFYTHQHLVRDFLTGNNGHRITNNEAGTFGSLTYRLQLPTTYRDVWLDPVNVELALFVTESEQNILNGIKLNPTLEANTQADANLIALKGPHDICGDDYQAQILLRNDGQTPLTSLTVNYGLDSGALTPYYWTGELATFETVLIDLPGISPPMWDLQQQIFVTLTEPNADTDPTAYNNSRSQAFTVAPVSPSQHLELALRTDAYGYEAYWEIIDAAGNIHASGGNQVVGETNGGAQIAGPEDAGAYPGNSLIIEDIYLPAEGCYQLRVLDDFADGWCCHYGNGFYRLRLPGQAPLLQGGDFGALETRYFTVEGSVVAIDEPGEATAAFVLAPNPLAAGQQLQLINPTKLSYHWQLFNSTGQLLEQGKYPNLPHTTQLARGYYLLHLFVADQSQTLPFLVQ